MKIRRSLPVLLLLTLLAATTLTGCGRLRPPDADVMAGRIRSILELPTYEQIYRDIVFVDREHSFLFFRTMHAQVLFSINIRVQAGVDFNDGLTLLPDAGGKSITVKLPVAKVFLIDADEATIQQYFLKESGGSIERLDYYDEIDRIKEKILADALKREILEKATLNARSLITGLLTAAGFEEVHFVPL